MKKTFSPRTVIDFLLFLSHDSDVDAEQQAQAQACDRELAIELLCGCVAMGSGEFAIGSWGLVRISAEFGQRKDEGVPLGGHRWRERR